MKGLVAGHADPRRTAKSANQSAEALELPPCRDASSPRLSSQAISRYGSSRNAAIGRGILSGCNCASISATATRRSAAAAQSRESSLRAACIDANLSTWSTNSRVSALNTGNPGADNADLRSLARQSGGRWVWRTASSLSHACMSPGLRTTSRVASSANSRIAASELHCIWADSTEFEWGHHIAA